MGESKAMQPDQRQLVVFWSWQSDSGSDTNRNFIESCLQKACKVVGRENAILLTVDRDTRGVGGTPDIADTILTKIRSADVFVWDATLVTLAPKPSPNPNVLFELGYAFAVLGDRRLIGVMNEFGVPRSAELPFDLKHRRWPIRYSLQSSRAERDWWNSVITWFTNRGRHPVSDRSAVQIALVRELASAIKAALAEPRGGALRADVDLHAAIALWMRLDSERVHDWYDYQRSHPQYETRESLDMFDAYLRLAARSECKFREEKLADLHERFIQAIESYLTASARERVRDGNPGEYVISVKASERFEPDYDAKYQRQIRQLEAAADAVKATWTEYLDELRSRYPEVSSASTSSL